MKITSKSEKDTIKIAEKLALQLKGGEVILLYGDLGAGKTVFVKALAKALGVKEVVKSPTFNLMKIYKTHLPPPPTPPRAGGGVRMLCHIDAYRLKNFDELLDIGADEYLGGKNVVSAIEWAERADIKSLNHKIIKSKENSTIIKIKIEHGQKDNERIIDIGY